MSRFIDGLDSFLQDYFNLSIPDMHITDFVEILIIAFFLYGIFKWIKSTRAWMLVRGILIVVLLFMVAAFFQMSAILWLGEKIFNAGLIALIVVFQPELRKALEQLGRRNLFRRILPRSWRKRTFQRFSDQTRTDIVKASFDMGAVKTGALIVIEQDVMLKEYERTGIPIDAVCTRQLLINIFEKNTPLHDGAVIVRQDRVVSATCYLPLTENLELSKELGTRHRAAVGISEVSDAVTIIVSEETGKVSVTKDGRLIHDVSKEHLDEILKKIQYIVLEREDREGRRRRKSSKEEEAGDEE